MRKFLFILFVFGVIGTSFGQGFHASTTKVDYDENGLKITAKFFTDDLENTLGVKTSSKAAFDGKAKSYALTKFEIRINGNKIALQYMGSQTNDKSTRLYFKADKVEKITVIEIRNAMLTAELPDQQNLVTFEGNGVRKSFTAKKGNETGKISL